MLSTTVGLAGSWFVAVPISAILTVVLSMDLQGQTSAVAVGYMVSGTLNTYILIQSDWLKLSRRAKALTAANEDDDDSSSSSSSSNFDSDGSESHGKYRTKRDMKIKTVTRDDTKVGEKDIPLRDRLDPRFGSSDNASRSVHGDSSPTNEGTLSMVCSMPDDVATTFGSMANSIAERFKI